MRRAALFEPELDRLLALARDAGVSLRVYVDTYGKAVFHAQGLGAFDEVEPLERALRDQLAVLS